MMVSCFPRASHSSRLPFILPSVAAACFWLVAVCKMINWQQSMANAPPISLFFAAPFDAKNNWTVFPHALLSQHASALTSPLPLSSTIRLIVAFYPQTAAT